MNIYVNIREQMYKVTYEQIQHVHENCVHSQFKVLNSGRDFASLKWFGKVVPYDCTFENIRLESIRLRPCTYLVLRTVSLSDCNDNFFDDSNPMKKVDLFYLEIYKFQSLKFECSVCRYWSYHLYKVVCARCICVFVLERVRKHR